MAIVIFEHSELSAADRLAVTLRDFGHRLHVVRLHRGDHVPVDLDGVDGLVSCGGPQSPLDDSLEWIEAEMNLLRRAHELSLPVVGLCLGCQLLGRALEGEVGELDGGIEAGFHEVRLTPVGREDPVLAGVAWRSMQLHWHRFQVSKIPPGARVLASSQRTQVQAWAHGLRTYGFQFHLEAWPGRLESWAKDDPGALEEAGMRVGQLQQQSEQHYGEMARLAQRIFDTMAMVLMPVDRRYAGIAKDLHH
jgi:GMP synthase-like glutamine amidotransferase